MRIAINTGGGDAPGLNAVIRAATHGAINLGWEIVGIRDGYEGLLDPERYDGKGLVPLTLERVSNISHLGGTVLGAVNRANPFCRPTRNAEGVQIEVDLSDHLLERFKEERLDALIAVGGDGSLRIAHELALKGLRVIGVPKTIDNDLESTAVTFGFQTAVNFATECIDRLHATAESHQRVFVIEVMGRYAGWIALYSGLAGRADAILIPEIPYDFQKVIEHVKHRMHARHYSLIVVAEGAFPAGGSMSVKESPIGREQVLGGIAERLSKQISELGEYETRTAVLGHLLRGGSPTAGDRMLGLTFGAAAVRALEQGMNDVMVAVDPPDIVHVPLADAVRAQRKVSLNHDGVLTARTLGICLGD